jgi:ribosome-associated protein
MSRPLVINPQIVIPASELAVTFARSSGPGGQNVNKVNSKAILRWNVQTTNSLRPEIKARFQASFSTRITQSGEIVISSDRFRDQGRNLSDCYEKLRKLIHASLVAPTKRRKTRPTRGSVEDRLANKRQKSHQKQMRGFRDLNET